MSDAVHLLAENNIFSAPVKDPRASSSDPWSVQYIGIVDYASIILWVLEQAELAAAAITTGSATAAGMGAGALGALGALVLGLTGPIAMAGVATVAVGAALAGIYALSLVFYSAYRTVFLMMVLSVFCSLS